MRRRTTRRVPKLRFTKTQNIGWHVTYRDPQSGVPRRYRFGNVERVEASNLYNDWLVEHLRGAAHRAQDKGTNEIEAAPPDTMAKVVPGSLLHVASNYLFFEEKRTRKPGEARRAGTIAPGVLSDRRHDVKEFLKFINKRYGPGSAGTVSVIDLKMVDGYSIGCGKGSDGRYHASVKIQADAFNELSAYFVGLAVHRSKAHLIGEFQKIRFVPYARVRRQLLKLLRLVNDRRKMCGFEPVPISALKLRRQIVKVFACEELRLAENGSFHHVEKHMAESLCTCGTVAGSAPSTPSYSEVDMQPSLLG